MRPFIKILVLLLIPVLARAQQHLPDSISRALKSASNDSLRYRASIQAYLYFEEINRDSALYYVNQTLLLARKNDKQLLIARALASKGYQLTGSGHYAEALKNLLQAFSIAQNHKNASSSWLLIPESTPDNSRLFILSLTHHMFGVLMDRTQNTEQELFHFKEAKRIATEIGNQQRIQIADMNIGNTYIDLNKIDSALIFENEAKDIAIKIGQKKYLSYILTCFGDIALKKGNKAKAKQFYYEGIHSAIEQNNIATLVRGYLKLTNFYLAQNEKDSSLYFATKMLENIKILGPTTSQQINIGVAYENLYDSYKLRKQLDSAFKYAGLALIAKDSVFKKRIENLSQFQTLSFREQLRLQDLEKEKVAYQSKIRTYALIAGLGVFFIIVLILYRNNLQKQKANKLLRRQNEEIEAQKKEATIEVALERIRSRTMAMHKSDELHEVIQLVFDQLQQLNFNIDVANFAFNYKETDDFDLLLAVPHGKYPMEIHVPYFKHPVFDRFNKAKKNGDLLTDTLTKDEKDSFFEYFFKYVTGVPEETKASIFGRPGFVRSSALMGNTALTIHNYDGISYSDAENNTLLRFGKVFEQTYTRFQDLQRAEAHAIQAREDLIKLHTEKKRAEDALTELQTAQRQLIQSEKMASLGELTAGIAHEIQNPLNFVNNFSEVNVELIDEMQEEIEKGDLEEVKAIANNIRENQQKISQHGKRADFIVKGMLQHSRTSTGERQPTNINLLADEFLKLSYHGLRAKDKNFNAELITNFDETLPKVNVVQQDIGRVLLNLFTNAFYAVNQKAKTAGSDYKPEVSVTTSAENDTVNIYVKDNGIGIPDAIKEKIMQPFFTTKPTGEGTGLGLSLSYDIVVKGHGGSIHANSKEGEGSEFIISIPVNS
jgi:signal transduction histidine kinase